MQDYDSIKQVIIPQADSKQKVGPLEVRKIDIRKGELLRGGMADFHGHRALRPGDGRGGKEDRGDPQRRHPCRKQTLKHSSHDSPVLMMRSIAISRKFSNPLY